MAINKLQNGNYQARLQNSDGRILSKVFPTKGEAEEQVLKWKQHKRTGCILPTGMRKVTVHEYFEEWFEAVRHQASPGWRRCQKQFYEEYVQPILGTRRLSAITPYLISQVLSRAAGAGRSEQTQLHIFNLMRKMFRDAEDLFQLVTTSPVLRTLKPKVPVKEARYLSVNQVSALLKYAMEKEYDLAIWVQVFLGLRVSELIALKWSDLDLDRGVVLIARSYSRKDSWVNGTKTFNDHPKGRSQHYKVIPSELLELLLQRKESATSEFVAESPLEGMLSYEFYLETLRRYCQELKLPNIGTHGLRHSASELYLHYGATEDDIRRLFEHSSPDITKRYLHSRGKNLDRITGMIRLFPGKIDQKSTNLPDQTDRPKT